MAYYSSDKFSGFLIFIFVLLEKIAKYTIVLGRAGMFSIAKQLHPGYMGR